MIYCFDLDGTLCTSTDGNYEKAEPIQDRIDMVNLLYDKGGIICIDTARGSETGKDWVNVSYQQLLKWGVKFHKLRGGIKYNADFYVDDKAINADDFFAKNAGK